MGPALRPTILTLGLILSALLLSLGAPRVIASLLKAPAFQSLRAAHAGEPLETVQLQTATRFLEKATRWEASGQLYGDLGFLLLLDAAARPTDDPQRQALAGRSLAAIEASLMLAPASPHGWLRLAYATTILKGPSPEVAALLERSLKIAPFLGALAPARIELLFQNWPHLSPEMRAALGPQIRYGWRHHGRALVAIAARGGQLRVLRLALRSVPGAPQRIDRFLTEIES